MLSCEEARRKLPDQSCCIRVNLVSMKSNNSREIGDCSPMSQTKVCLATRTAVGRRRSCKASLSTCPSFIVRYSKCQHAQALASATTKSDDLYSGQDVNVQHSSKHGQKVCRALCLHGGSQLRCESNLH